MRLIVVCAIIGATCWGSLWGTGERLDHAAGTPLAAIMRIAKTPSASMVMQQKSIAPPYRISLATRRQFETAASRQKKWLTPLAKSDTLQRLTKSAPNYQFGDPKIKYKYAVLRLKLANGGTKDLVSKSDEFEEEQTFLTYEGKISAIHKYVLHVNYYEGNEYILVDRKTGRTDTLAGPPVGSPSLIRLAAVFQRWPYETYGGIQVCSTIGGKLERTFTLNREGWVPQDLAWVSDQELIVQGLSIAEVEKTEKLNRQLTPAEFRRQNYTYLRVTIAK